MRDDPPFHRQQISIQELFTACFRASVLKEEDITEILVKVTNTDTSVFCVRRCAVP